MARNSTGHLPKGLRDDWVDRIYSSYTARRPPVVRGGAVEERGLRVESVRGITPFEYFRVSPDGNSPRPPILPTDTVTVDDFTHTHTHMYARILAIHIDIISLRPIGVSQNRNRRARARRFLIVSASYRLATIVRPEVRVNERERERNVRTERTIAYAGKRKER